MISRSESFPSYGAHNCKLRLHALSAWMRSERPAGSKGRKRRCTSIDVVQQASQTLYTPLARQSSTRSPSPSLSLPSSESAAPSLFPVKLPSSSRRKSATLRLRGGSSILGGPASSSAWPDVLGAAASAAAASALRFWRRLSNCCSRNLQNRQQARRHQQQIQQQIGPQLLHACAATALHALCT